MFCKKKKTTTTTKKKNTPVITTKWPHSRQKYRCATCTDITSRLCLTNHDSIDVFETLTNYITKHGSDVPCNILIGFFNAILDHFCSLLAPFQMIHCLKHQWQCCSPTKTMQSLMYKIMFICSITKAGYFAIITYFWVLFIKPVSKQNSLQTSAENNPPRLPHGWYVAYTVWKKMPI